ncbi:MAG TPA: hypothetical protein PLC79_08815 [Phycisphaerae bacterium]|nr:hypothetical protein [Phycisphaerae bacterium]
MNRPRWIMLIVAAAAAGWYAFGHHLVQSKAKPPGPAAAKVYDPVPNEAPLHGMAVQITHVYDVVNRTKKLLSEVADLGADTVMLSAARYQAHAASPAIVNDPQRMPTDEQWRAIIEAAHALHLRVLLMPIVLLSDPKGTEWRGEIKPPNWDVWWQSYDDYILHMARIAEANHVEVMTVGSELVSTEKYTDRWEKLIRQVRKVYRGKLSYSANWDHYRNIEFWKDLDYVGMTTYYQLSDDPNPTLEKLLDAWKPIKEEILSWQKTVRKPIIFTEVGWCSQEGASVEAWNYYHKQQATAAGREEQRRLYVAFMQTWRDCPQVGGVIWWEWTDSDGGDDDYNYTPRGKPAEKELRRWFRERRDWARRNIRPASRKTNNHSDARPLSLQERQPDSVRPSARPTDQ